MIFRDFLLSGIVIATTLWYVLVSDQLTCALIRRRFVSNRLLLSPPSHSAPADSSVEWAYVFDVHTNAFFPFYLTLYLAQLFLLPIVLKGNWVCLWLGNTLYLAAYVGLLYPYHCISVDSLPLLASPNTHMEFISGLVVSNCISDENCLPKWKTALPFLIRSELLLTPLLPLFTAYILSLLGFNVAKHVLSAYFGQ